MKQADQHYLIKIMETADYGHAIMEANNQQIIDYKLLNFDVFMED